MFMFIQSFEASATQVSVRKQEELETCQQKLACYYYFLYYLQHNGGGIKGVARMINVFMCAGERQSKASAICYFHSSFACIWLQ